MAVDRTVLRMVVLCGLLLQLCEADNLKCTATRRENRMIYSVDLQGFPPDVDLSSCDFSWSTDGTVLANHQDKLSSVERKSLITLETKECFTNVVHKFDCASKKTAHLTNFQANCTTSCSKEDHKVSDGHSAPLDLAGIIVPVLGGLCVVVGGYFLYKRYKPKKENHSELTSSCTQWGGRYKNVKVSNPDSPV